MAQAAKADVTILDETTAVSILLLIDKRGEARAYDLRQIAGGYDRMKNLTKRMESIGLLKIQIEEKPRLTYLYSLTPKGKKVAQKLTEIDQIIRAP